MENEALNDMVTNTSEESLHIFVEGYYWIKENLNIDVCKLMLDSKGRRNQ